MKTEVSPLASMAIIGLLVCCARPQKQSERPAQASIEAKQVAALEQAPYVTEFEFAKGQSRLPKHARQRIDTLLQRANANGSVDEIKVITWADAEFPSVHSSQLPPSDVALANARLNTIKTHIGVAHPQVPVSEYNMAQRPGLFSRLMESSDARIKKALEVAGIPNTDTSVKLPRKASKAIVLVLMKP